MGIPVYWALPSTCSPSPMLKPSLKRTRPLPSSIRRHPLPRDRARLYSDIVRLHSHAHNLPPQRSPSPSSSSSGAEDCPPPPNHALLEMADRYVAAQQSSSDDSDVPFINEGLYPDPDYPQRNPRVHPHRFPIAWDPRQIPTPVLSSNRHSADFQDGMPTPTTERAPTEPRDDAGEDASRGADAVTPPPETQEREWGSPSWREESWPDMFTRGEAFREEFRPLLDTVAMAPLPPLEQESVITADEIRRLW